MEIHISRKRKNKSKDANIYKDTKANTRYVTTRVWTKMVTKAEKKLLYRTKIISQMLLFISRKMSDFASMTLPLDRLGIILQHSWCSSCPGWINRISYPDMVKETEWVSELFPGNHFCERREHKKQEDLTFWKVSHIFWVVGKQENAQWKISKHCERMKEPLRKGTETMTSLQQWNMAEKLSSEVRKTSYI